MSTNSLIAMKTSDGKVKAVYCHWDGYLGYVGRILINYYDNLDKVKTLINLGSISSLGVNPYIELDGGLTNEEGFRLAVSDYHRMREENINILEFDSFKDLDIYFQQHQYYEYMYYYCIDKNGNYRWLYKQNTYYRKSVKDKFGYYESVIDTVRNTKLRTLTNEEIFLEDLAGFVYITKFNQYSGSEYEKIVESKLNKHQIVKAREIENRSCRFFVIDYLRSLRIA